MNERGKTVTPFTAVAAVGGVLGVCGGLPVLFSLVVADAVAGLSTSDRSMGADQHPPPEAGSGPVGPELPQREFRDRDVVGGGLGARAAGP